MKDEISSLVVLLASGGIHYIGTSLEEHVVEMKVEATRGLLLVHRLIKVESTTTLTDSNTTTCYNFDGSQECLAYINPVYRTS